MSSIKLRNTKRIVETALKSRFSLIMLCLWSYTEAFIFPIPPDPFLTLGVKGRLIYERFRAKSEI